MKIIWDDLKIYIDVHKIYLFRAGQKNQNSFLNRAFINNLNKFSKFGWIPNRL